MSGGNNVNAQPLKRDRANELCERSVPCVEQDCNFIPKTYRATRKHYNLTHLSNFVMGIECDKSNEGCEYKCYKDIRCYSEHMQSHSQVEINKRLLHMKVVKMEYVRHPDVRHPAIFSEHSVICDSLKKKQIKAKQAKAKLEREQTKLAKKGAKRVLKLSTGNLGQVSNEAEALEAAGEGGEAHNVVEGIPAANVITSEEGTHAETVHEENTHAETVHEENTHAEVVNGNEEGTHAEAFTSDNTVIEEDDYEDPECDYEDPEWEGESVEPISVHPPKGSGRIFTETWVAKPFKIKRDPDEVFYIEGEGDSNDYLRSLATNMFQRQEKKRKRKSGNTKSKKRKINTGL